jgi:membrane protein YqaA with SNARE-associated domain
MRLFLKFFAGPYALVALAFASLLDMFIVVIPTDGLMVATVITGKRRWIAAALAPAIGSVIGSAVLAWLASEYGMTALEYFSPDLHNSATWLAAQKFFERWGDFAIFLTGLSPFGQQPMVLLVGLAKVPMLHIVVSLLLGRFIKNLVVCYIAKRSPEFVQTLPWVGQEFKEVLRKIEEGHFDQPKNSKSP